MLPLWLDLLPSLYGNSHFTHDPPMNAYAWLGKKQFAIFSSLDRQSALFRQCCIFVHTSPYAFTRILGNKYAWSGRKSVSTWGPVCSILEIVWGWECAYSCADLGCCFAPCLSGFTNCVSDSTSVLLPQVWVYTSGPNDNQKPQNNTNP